MADTTAPQTAAPQRADPQRAATHRSPQRSRVARSSVARLQQTVGNQSIHRLLQTRAIQPKLTVGPVDDEYEREADRVADDIVRMPDASADLSAQRVSPRLQRLCPECEEDKKQDETTDTDVQRAPAVIQRLCPECEEEEAQRTPDPIQRMCPECEEEAQGEVAHRKADESEIQRALIPLEKDNEEEEKKKEEETKEAEPTSGGGGVIQAKRAGSDPPDASTGLTAYVQNSRQGGQPLPEGTRTGFESRFGQDFGGVRVHTGARAADAAAEINALAFTTGSDIYFGSGRFNPGTPEGDRLLAHELTHTIQQTGGRRLAPATDHRQTEPDGAEPSTESSPEGDIGRKAGQGVQPMPSAEQQQTRPQPQAAKNQAVLKVVPVDGEHDREANPVAEDVTRMREPGATRASIPLARSVIQRRCPECEKEEEEEEEKILRQATRGHRVSSESLSPEVAARIHALEGRGELLPASDRRFMESRFSRAFDNVRIHRGAHAAQLADAVDARAFTFGRDIVFGAGEYRPHTAAGRHVLAHELTHTIQQAPHGRRSIQRQSALDVTSAFLGPLSAGALHLARETPVELQGYTHFEPSFLVATYIQFLGETGETVPVKVKFGDLAKGQAQVRWHASTGTYEMLPVLLPMRHPGIKVNESRDTLALFVRSLWADSSIIGHMGFTPGLTAATLPRLLGASAVGQLLTDENMFKAILGEDYDRGELQVYIYENLIAGGLLKMSFAGVLTVAGGQRMIGAFTIINDAHAWKGSLTPHVKGLEDKELEVARSAKAELSAEGDGLTVTSEWTHNGFVNAKLTASYVNGALQIRGDASIQTDRLQGEATLLVADEDTARAAAEAELPVPLVLPAGTPSGSKALAITGWGTVKAVLIKDKAGKDLLTGDAAFVVEPEGYVTISGTIKVPKRFTLIEAKPTPWKEHYRTPEFRAWFSPIWAPGGVRVKASGGLSSRYTLGPVTLYQIEASGLYSTNPKIPNELSISARLNASAEAQGRVSIEGEAAARFGTRFDYVGVDAATAGVKLDATGTLKGYVDVAPTIGMREDLAAGGMPQVFVKGTVDIGGELDIGFTGQFHIEVLAAKWEKTIEFGKRTIGGFNISIELDHTFGEDSEPTIKVKTGDFERGKFVKAILLEKKVKDTDELTGGYKEEGKELADITATETPVSDAPPPEPEKIEDDFTMQGVRHVLTLELGAPGDPAQLLMATDPEPLVAKIEVTKNVLSVTYAVLDEDERAEMDRRLRDLDKIKTAAERVLKAATKLGIDPTKKGATRIPGFQQLGDLISEYGDRYDVTDIKPEPAGEEPSPGTRQNPFELVWPKPPTAGYPTIYLGGRIDKLKTQSVLKGIYAKGQNDETGVPVKEYTPHRGGKLPGGETIGISPAFRIHLGRIVGPLSEETTPGGGKLNRILNRYGYYATQEHTEADHVQEIQFGGPDDVANMWMLDETINAAAGPKLGNATATYPKTGRTVKISELKTRTKSYFFKITRFEF